MNYLQDIINNPIPYNKTEVEAKIETVLRENRHHIGQKFQVYFTGNKNKKDLNEVVQWCLDNQDDIDLNELEEAIRVLVFCYNRERLETIYSVLESGNKLKTNCGYRNTFA